MNLQLHTMIIVTKMKARPTSVQKMQNYYADVKPLNQDQFAWFFEHKVYEMRLQAM